MVDFLQRIGLQDKVGIVVGGGRGIGRASSLLLAEAGANVVIVDLEKDRAQAAADERTGDLLLSARDGCGRRVPAALSACDVGSGARACIRPSRPPAQAGTLPPDAAPVSAARATA